VTQLLTQQDLADRWQVEVRTIENYRKSGIIQPVKGIPTIRFTEQHILELEGLKLDKMSPIERRRLEREINELKCEVEKLNLEKEQLKGIIANVLAETSQVFNLKREAS
jgi:hypothetical protein